MVTGTKASAATRQVLLEAHPELRALYDGHLRSDQPFDLRPQLALTKALVEHYINNEGTKTWGGPKGGEPPILRAVAALETCARVAQRIVEIEDKVGPVTRAELEALINAFAPRLPDSYRTRGSRRPRTTCAASLPLPVWKKRIAKGDEGACPHARHSL